MSEVEVRVPRVAYSPEEAAAALGVSRALIYKLMSSGELRSIKLGRARRIPVDVVSEKLRGDVPQ